MHGQPYIKILNNVRREVADISGTKKRHIWEIILRNLKLTVRSKILGTCIGASVTLRKGTSLDVI